MRRSTPFVYAACDTMRRFALFAVILAACMPSGPSPGVYSTWQGPRVRIENTIIRYQLPNGLDVILNPDNRLPVVALTVQYRVGWKDDPPGQSGLAHLFEHLMFQGSRHVGEDMFMRYLERVGCQFVNGSTSDDRTVYAETVPASQLELALWLESDRMGFVLDHVAEGTFDIQKRVVANEARDLGERAYSDVGRLISARLFPEGHPYHGKAEPIEDLDHLTLDDVRSFYATYYRPNNATLLLSGTFDVERAKHLIQQYFEPIVRGAPLPKTRLADPPPIQNGARLDITAGVRAEHVILTWLTPPFAEEGDAELDIISEVMNRSVLTWNLVSERQLATSVVARQRSRRRASTFVIDITTRPGAAVDAVLGAANEEIEKLRHEDQSARFIRSMTFPMMLHLASVHENPTSRVSQIANDLFMTGDPAYIERNVIRYENISSTSIKQAAQKFLSTDHELVTVVTPQMGAPAGGWLADRSHAEGLPPRGRPQVVRSLPTLTTPDADFRQRPPAAAPEAPFALPIPRETTLENGLRIILVEDHRMPTVAISLALPRGAANAPPAVATAAIRDLFAGTTYRDRSAISRAFALGGAISTQRVGLDWMAFDVAALSFGTTDALVLLGDVLTHATLPEVELERNRSRDIAIFRTRSTESIFFEQITSALLPRGHPYAGNPAGDEESIRRVRRDDIVAFLRANMQPNQAVLAVAGDVTWDELVKVTRRSLGAWQGTVTPVKRPAPVTPPVPSPTIVILDRVGAIQADIRVTALGPPPDSPDHLAFSLLTAAMGDVINGRLFANLREAHGYSYSPHGNLLNLPDASILSLSASVATAHANDSLAEIEHEMSRMRTENISDEELALAKLALTRGLSSGYRSLSAAARTLAALAVENHPLDEPVRWVAALRDIGPDRIREVAQQYLAPERLHTFVLGDATGLRRELHDRALEARSLDTFHPHAVDLLQAE
jgi:zinc protease